MEKSDFLALPPSVALRVLFDCLDQDTVKALGHAEKLVAPKSPKFDRAIFRKEGVMYASETSLEGLRFWHKRSAESANGGGQYADKDRKNAEELARWIAWREWYPDATWSGERNRDAIVAKPPSDKPTVYPRTGGNRPPPPPPDDDINTDSEIPF